jgi:hypothetical protein
VLLLVVALVACKERAHLEDDAIRPSKMPPEGHVVDLAHARGEAAKTKTVQEPKRAPLGDQEMAILRKHLPRHDDMPVIEKLKSLPHSRLARMVLCPTQWTVEEAASQLMTRLEKAGWTDGTMHRPSSDGQRRTMSAKGHGFRVTATVQSGILKDCKSEDRGVRVMLTFLEDSLASITDKVQPVLRSQAPNRLVAPNKVAAPTPPPVDDNTIGRKPSEK